MITGSSLRQTNRNLQKSLERLSTGLRINRAADDAAGLSVSEQLRTQVRGLNMEPETFRMGSLF
jgi:flagellin